MDIDLNAWAKAIGYRIIGDKVIPQGVYDKQTFAECVAAYISETLGMGVSSGAVAERFFANADERQALLDMLEESKEFSLEEKDFVSAFEKYVLVGIVERDISTPEIYDTWEEAFDAMKDDLVDKLGGEEPDDFPEDIRELVLVSDYQGDEMGINANSAWLNKRDNYDWQIFRITMEDGKLKIEL